VTPFSEEKKSLHRQKGKVGTNRDSALQLGRGRKYKPLYNCEIEEIWEEDIDRRVLPF